MHITETEEYIAHWLHHRDCEYSGLPLPPTFDPSLRQDLDPFGFAEQHLETMSAVMARACNL